MITIPKSNPEGVRVVTALVGASTAALAYFFPSFLPGLAAAVPALPKLLWALGLLTAGAGGVTVVKAPS